MKKFLLMGVCALGLMAMTQQQASAWCNFKFGAGVNMQWQSGGTSCLWGAFHGAQPPGPDCGSHFGGPQFGGPQFGAPQFVAPPAHIPAPVPAPVPAPGVMPPGHAHNAQRGAQTVNFPAYYPMPSYYYPVNYYYGR